MTISPLSSFSRLPPFDSLVRQLSLPTPIPSPTVMSPQPLSSFTTPGVRPEQVTLTSQPLGRGSFGSVWRADFSGSPVAVKICPLHSTNQNAIVQFRREMSRYHHLRHPCITQFFCVVHHPDNLLLVTELMKGGSLFEALSSIRKSTKFHLQPTSMLRIANHITNGLAYLHASSFSFGDLKSMNVLLSEKPNLHNASFSSSVQAKLCDFGLSRNLKHLIKPDQRSPVFDTQIPARNGPAGTFAYLAPEAFSGLPVDDAYAPKAADIYALGIVLWELVTLRSPWPGKQPLQLIKLVRKEGRRPPWPSDTSYIPPGYIEIVESCWHQDPAQRPSVDSVAVLLDKILQSLPGHIDPRRSFYERRSFYNRASAEPSESFLTRELDALHVEDQDRCVQTTAESADDMELLERMPLIKHVKSMRIETQPNLKPCNSDMSACTAAFGTRTNSHSRLSMESFPLSDESQGFDAPRPSEPRIPPLKSHDDRISYVSSENGPDSGSGEQLPASERSDKSPPSSQRLVYVVPPSERNGVQSIDTELLRFEAEEDLNVRRLGISMNSRPHFR